MADSKRILILGATSGIAEAAARRWAAEGASLLLVGRDATRLDTITADLKLRGGTVQVASLDLVTADAAAGLAAFAARLGGIDVILLAYGIMPSQDESRSSPAVLRSMFETNFLSAALWAEAAATLLEAQKSGCLIVLGSPAGDRGRRKNYLYGATKAGIATLVEGIAHRLDGTGARAVLLKPGPTRTAMTAGLPGNMSEPADIAGAIVRAAESGGSVQYAPARWALIMAVIRHLPWTLFRRTNF
jgi:decaprenylphospho-beta-D-erythro-pentofuranosid-2-ulose 2-reductase